MAQERKPPLHKKPLTGAGGAEAISLRLAAETVGAIRRLNRFVLLSAISSVILTVATILADHSGMVALVYVRLLALASAGLLAMTGIGVVLSVENIPRVTPLICAGGVALVVSEILQLTRAIPLFSWVPILGATSSISTPTVTDLLMFGGASMLMSGCYLGILDATGARLRLGTESEERKLALVQQKRAEAALRESETRYRQLVDLSPVGILVQVEGRIVFANKATARIVGAIKHGDLIGQSLLRFVAPESRDIAKELIRQSVADAADQPPIELKVNTVSGIPMDVEANSIPIDFHGRVASQIVLHDIADRKHAEAEKEKFEEQMRQAQKMEAIGTLAGGVAHDFNNLLAGILGYAGMLREHTNHEKKAMRAVSMIEKAAERAAKLTEQLLGFARKGKLQIIKIDVHRSIQEVIALLGRTIDKRIQIKRRFIVDEAMIQGDPVQIQQVFLNLTLNARDAMSEGGIIRFETSVIKVCDEDTGYTGLAPGKYVQVTISDTGQGIPKDVLPHIFEPFFTTKDQGDGTGMGLAMVYGIVQNHGGKIFVYSEPNLGTTFRVCLPVATAEAAIPDETKDIAPVHGTGRILVVDDEEVVREMISDILESLGYSVTTVNDGVEAVEYYRAFGDEIDLAIIDMVMPRMDGGDCFRTLKGINPEIRAVLTTGYSRDGAAQQILDEGMLGFAQKPYRVNQLSEIVANAMGGCAGSLS